jgi:hypothetical protein
MFLKQLWTREEAADVNILSSELGSSNVLPSRPHVRALKPDSLPFCHSRRKQYLPRPCQYSLEGKCCGNQLHRVDVV